MINVDLTEATFPEELFGKLVKLNGKFKWEANGDANNSYWSFQAPTSLNNGNLIFRLSPTKQKIVKIDVPPFQNMERIINAYIPEPETGLTRNDIIRQWVYFQMGKPDALSSLTSKGILYDVLDIYFDQNVIIRGQNPLDILNYKYQARDPDGYIVAKVIRSKGELIATDLEEVGIFNKLNVHSVRYNDTILDDIDLGIDEICPAHRILQNTALYEGQELRIAGWLWLDENKQPYLIPAPEFAVHPDCKAYGFKIINGIAGFHSLPGSLVFGGSREHGNTVGQMHIIAKISTDQDGLICLTKLASAIVLVPGYGVYQILNQNSRVY